LFAGEKTEPATDKRREEARESGNVPKSQDLESTLVLLACLILLKYWGPYVFIYMGDYMRYTLAHSLTVQLDVHTLMGLFGGFMVVFLKCTVPIFLLIVVVAASVNIAQLQGLLFTFDPLMPDFDKLNPFSGFANLFTWKSVGELVKSLLKIGIVSYIPYSTLREQMPFLIRFVQLEPMSSTVFLFKLIYSMSMDILLILLVLSIGDWYFQEWMYEENMKMSKEEIKEEYKQREGDPKVKQKIKERQRRLASQRMMAEVPKATVVVTNPTHIAVAIFYDKDAKPHKDPQVTAMGTGLIAERIKEIAREHDVPIIENKPLAQELLKVVEVGDFIPEELFQTVALILAQVYKIKEKVPA